MAENKPLMAVVCGIILIGLGQVYNRQISKAVGIWILAISLVIFFGMVGVGLLVPLQIFALYDAYTQAKKKSILDVTKSTSTPSTPEQLETTKFCIHCGKDLPSTVSFCNSCGRSQKPIEPTEPNTVEHEEIQEDEGLGRKGLLTLAGVVAVIVIIIFVGLSMSGPSQTPIQTTQQTPVQYTFTGTGGKESYTFYIPTREWVIWYDVKATYDPSYSTLVIFVYPEGESALFVSSINYNGAGQDYSIVHHGPGRYYLKIISANCDYTIVVKAPP
ncbi:hypothetical protein A3K80_08080 [Candidatus Bathyarchaeota archaeon RBG_13_38_9]|nr:MAG: hypothetical protein A3K80_08080 [Candidatus Bathyarchaeota archaeon RBG_13_38_9]